jgi:hypothetical protein
LHQPRSAPAQAQVASLALTTKKLFSMTIMPQPPPLSEVWQIIHKEDWSSPAFSRAKAYVCAIFAELAYWHIPKFELADRDRLKVVPSEAYQELVDTLVHDHDLVTRLQAVDFASVVIARRRAVVVVANAGVVIFVAIRGTVGLYDWRTNFQLGRLTTPDGNGRFHAGFYRAIEDAFEPLLTELRRYRPEIPVYVTGHSLGGGMAALLHATWIACRACGKSDPGNPPTHSAYTFGMPRYGDDTGVQAYRCPHHIIKTQDIVPRAPPMWLGYANSLTEYDDRGTPINRAYSLETIPFVSWSWTLAKKRALPGHSIEGYRRDLRP